MKSVHHPAYQVLIDCLKEVRVKSELTQAELGSRIGMDQTYISKYENKERRIDLIELQIICQALNISLVDFVHEFEKRLKEQGGQSRSKNDG